ncbi:MAG: hypothetical protein NTW75_14065 [Planctomycetales bacterium]|nr:hypothetical protein [Planctomycetales bacterium]
MTDLLQASSHWRYHGTPLRNHGNKQRDVTPIMGQSIPRPQGNRWPDTGSRLRTVFETRRGLASVPPTVIIDARLTPCRDYGR